MHLFEHWPEPSVNDEKKRSFFYQVCLHIQKISQHSGYMNMHSYDGFIERFTKFQGLLTFSTSSRPRK